MAVAAKSAWKNRVGLYCRARDKGMENHVRASIATGRGRSPTAPARGPRRRLAVAVLAALTATAAGMATAAAASAGGSPSIRTAVAPSGLVALQAPATSPATAPPVATVDAPGARASGVVYGSALRGRWVSIPGWVLSTFTKKNMPVSTYGFGAEVFRRKDNRDLTIGLMYQKMGPPDGNWLGSGYQADIDTDLVQFRNFGMVGLDFSSVWRVRVHDNVGFRYGGGLGVALITGKVLRTSAFGCTEQNAGNTSACRPRYCPAQGPCPESLHVTNQGPLDGGPNDPHRYQDSHIPGAIPVINVVVGFDFHIPDVKGLELRLEGGFYDAFFLGAGAAWLF
jgi:hypothetical protein